MQVQMDELQNLILDRKSRDEQSNVMTYKMLTERYNLVGENAAIVLPLNSLVMFDKFEDVLMKDVNFTKDLVMYSKKKYAL